MKVSKSEFALLKDIYDNRTFYCEFKRVPKRIQAEFKDWVVNHKQQTWDYPRERDGESGWDRAFHIYYAEFVEFLKVVAKCTKK